MAISKFRKRQREMAAEAREIKQKKKEREAQCQKHCSVHCPDVSCGETVPTESGFDAGNSTGKFYHHSRHYLVLV